MLLWMCLFQRLHSRLILIIWGFHIGEFTCSLQLICNLQINTLSASVVIYKHLQRLKAAYCSAFLRARRLWCALWRKCTGLISQIQAWVTVAVSLTWLNHQYILNKVYLNRNRYKARWGTDQLTKMWLPLEAMVQYLLIQCLLFYRT